MNIDQGLKALDRYTGLRNAAEAVLIGADGNRHGICEVAVEAIERLRNALDAAPTFTDPAPNRVILTIEGGIVQAVHADRPQEILVTVLDMDVETEDHPSIYRVKDANGIETLVGVGGPDADPIGPGLESVLTQIDYDARDLRLTPDA